MSAAPVIELTNADVYANAQYGLMRTLNEIAAGRKLEAGRIDLGFGPNIIGALGEFALAAWLGVPYRPEVRKPDTDRGDVAGCQIRTTTRAKGSLIIREQDPEDFPYVLATLSVRRRSLVVTLPGWLDGVAAKDPRWWQERDPARGIHQAAWFVDQAALHPMATLPAADERRAA